MSVPGLGLGLVHLIVSSRVRVRVTMDLVQKSSHPWVLVFHLLFKAGAIASYVLAGLASGLVPFILVILLVAFDFYTVKNISGRLLVGKRYWNRIAHDGSSEWVFESMPRTNKTDRWVFWYTLYLLPLVWGVLGVLCILRLQVQWFLACLVAFSAASANCIGYYKCKKTTVASGGPGDAEPLQESDPVEQWVTGVVSSQISSRIQTSIVPDGV